MSPVGQILVTVLWVYFLLLIFRLVMEYVFIFARSFRPSGAFAALLELVYSATDPPLRFVRRFIPPLRLGNFSLDLGFLVVIIAVQILIGVAGNL
jgi:YggT family protein